VKKWIEKYKELKKSPKGRALLFFGFYFIFFAAIFTFLRFYSTPLSSSEEVEESYSFNVESLSNMNAHFRYTVLLDNTKYVYDGKERESIELFSFQDKEYYYNGSNYFVNEDMWVKSENPYLFYDFINPSKMILFFQQAYLDSETSYKSGKTAYHFILDTNTIYQLLFNKNTDYVDDGNMIVVDVDENGNVTSIVFQLDNYCKSIDTCEKSLKLEIEYDELGKVEEIKNPIE